MNRRKGGQSALKELTAVRPRRIHRGRGYME